MIGSSDNSIVLVSSSWKAQSCSQDGDDWEERDEVRVPDPLHQGELFQPGALRELVLHLTVVHVRQEPAHRHGHAVYEQDLKLNTRTQKTVVLFDLVQKAEALDDEIFTGHCHWSHFSTLSQLCLLDSVSQLVGVDPPGHQGLGREPKRK